MNNTTSKKTAFAAALLAAFALTYADTSSARDDHYPQDQVHRDDHRDERHDDRHDDRRDNRDDRQDHRDDHHDQRHDDRHDDHRRYHAPRYQPPRGYQQRSWGEGDVLPRGYRSSSYVVYDYRSYRLPPPPRGHRWVRVDNDVVMITISDGRITQHIGGIFY